LILTSACGCIGYRTPLDPGKHDPGDGAFADAPLRPDSPADRAAAKEVGVELGVIPAKDGSADLPVAADLRGGADLSAVRDLPAVGDLPAVRDLPAFADLSVAADQRPITPDAVDARPDVSPDLPDADRSEGVAVGDATIAGSSLTVIKTGSGGGTVTSAPAGIQCGSVCSASFATSSVVLSARTTNGSDSRFAGWGGACAGLGRDCTVAVTGATTVTARFEPIINNLVFVSSVSTFTTDLGSAAAYDGQCNQLATAAGINNMAGDAYIAWVSDTHSSAVSRVGTAHGFVRLDGEPVGDDPAEMITSYRIYNPIDVDENGVTPSGGGTVLTGMDSSGNGTLDTDCNDWTTKSGTATGIAGSAADGPVIWYFWEGGPCQMLVGGIYCFMKTKTAALTISPATGRKVFLTNGPVAIGKFTDARCESDKPSGTGKVSAFRATTTTPASALVDSTATYVRPDGIVVGQGADLLSGNLKSGIWQQGNGQYVENHAVWTGSDLPTQVGSSANTCSDWSNNSGANVTGASSATGMPYWSDPVPWTCASTYTWAYCIEN